MTSSLLFALSAVRAIAEMLGLCLIAQASMYFLLGNKRFENPIYRLFSLLTAAPRKLIGYLLPATVSRPVVALCCFIVILVVWLGLAVLRKFI